MNFDTRLTLQTTHEGSTRLVIDKDISITHEDAKIIALHISMAPLLDYVSVSNCELPMGTLRPIAAAIREHPSITKVNLSGSYLSNMVEGKEGNVVGDPLENDAEMLSILLANKRIHTLFMGTGSLSRSAEDELLRADTITSFRTEYKSFDFRSESFLTAEHSRGVKNLINANVWLGNIQQLRFIKRNRRLANNLYVKLVHSPLSLTALYNGDPLSTRNLLDKKFISGLVKRMPAILAIADKKGTRSKAISQLILFNRKMPAEHGIRFDVESYMTRVDILGVRAMLDGDNVARLGEACPANRDWLRTALPNINPQLAPPVAPLVPKFKLLEHVSVPASDIPLLTNDQTSQTNNLPTIAEVRTQVPALSADELRNQLDAAAHAPRMLMNWGADTVSVVSDIALASLHASTLAGHFDSPAHRMVEFLEKFSAAKAVVLERTAKPGRMGQLIINVRAVARGKVGDTAHQLKAYAQASALADEAGRILQDIVPALQNMERSVGNQLEVTHDIITAYNETGRQLCMMSDIGNEAIAQCRNKPAADPKIAAPGERFMDLHDDFYLQTLQARVELFEQLGAQIDGHIAQHKMDITVDTRQLQGLAILRIQNIPLLAEKVATFVRQVERLERAGMINGVADVTRDANKNEQDLNVQAAISIVDAIENLAGSTRDALKDMVKTVDQVADQLDPKQPSKHRPLLQREEFNYSA